ncbi:MAG: proton-conducting transporter membrane subunit [Candidatus Omnitrophota bacterium]
MPDIQQSIPLFILIPLLGVFLLALIARKKNFNADLILFFVILILLLLCGPLFGFIKKSGMVVYCLGAWRLPEAISFIVDGLAAFFLTSVCLVGFCLMLFSLRFIDLYGEKWKFYSLFLLLLTGVNGVIIAGDLFTMYLFMEAAAVASYALVCFSLENKALAFGFKYMIKGVMASAIIFLAIAVCYCYTSTLALADIANQLYTRQNVANDPGMVFVVLFIQSLLFLGFLIKSGIVPVYSWVADSQDATLALVSAILGAVIIPVLGIYPFIRIYFNIIGPNPESLAMLRIIAVLAMLGALVWALRKQQLKPVIAYHTMAEFAFVLLGIGIGTRLGVLAGLLHLLNTQVAVALVNCNAGLIDYIFHPKKSGLSGYGFKQMPGAFISSFFSSGAFFGLPPFFGFWTKLLIIFAAWQAGYKLSAFGAILAMGIVGVSFFKTKNLLFLKNSDYEPDPKIRKIKPVMALALMLMIGLCLGLNLLLFSTAQNTFVRPAIKTILSATNYSKTVFKAENEK